MNTKRLATDGWRLARISAALFASLFAGTSFAQQNCVTLKTEGQMEQEYKDAQGKAAKRLVAPGKVVPGNEIIWTITASNSCAKAAEKVVIENAVPEHMSYVADTAMGTGSEITFSLNGRDYKKAADLSVADADGKNRPARPEEIKSIRWVLGTPVAPKSIAFVRYRARVQ